jgi:hypothetical protein
MFVKGYSWTRLRPVATWIQDHAAVEAVTLLFVMTLVSLWAIAVQSFGFSSAYGWLVSNAQWIGLNQLLLGALVH